MKIAMIASEASPFAKTGGLADVLGTLSSALERLGHEVLLIIPAHREVLRGGFALEDTGEKLLVAVSSRQEEATVMQTKIGKFVTVLLVRADRYFDREYLYGTAAAAYADNAERFVFFSRAALEILRAQSVDIVHAHDWQAALTIVFLKTQAERYHEIAGAKTVLTIHNMGFQGIFGQSEWHLLNLDSAFFTPQSLEFYGNINFLKGVLIFADKLTTVSPTYAKEIMSPDQGFGLDGVLHDRAGDLLGILNGVDYTQWNPWTDPLISHHYGPNSLTIKRSCKKTLRQIFGLPDQPRTPIIAMISRLTAQKGFALVDAIFPELMSRDLQFVLLGNGEAKYEDFFRAAAQQYPDRVAVRIRFDETLAHQIEAGADIFLMPSLYEPCGLNQLFSLKYGTPPIVHEVGGLRDSVQDYDAESGTGTGFVFTAPEPLAFLDAIDRSLSVYGDNKTWTALRRRAMAMDFSWDRSAQSYSHLYQQLIG